MINLSTDFISLIFSCSFFLCADNSIPQQIFSRRHKLAPLKQLQNSKHCMAVIYLQYKHRIASFIIQAAKCRAVTCHIKQDEHLESSIQEKIEQHEVARHAAPPVWQSPQHTPHTWCCEQWNTLTAPLPAPPPLLQVLSTNHGSWLPTWYITETLYVNAICEYNIWIRHDII